MAATTDCLHVFCFVQAESSKAHNSTSVLARLRPISHLLLIKRKHFVLAQVRALSGVARSPLSVAQLFFWVAVVTVVGEGLQYQDEDVT